MTFAIFQNESNEPRKVVGMLYAADESNARAMAPLVLAADIAKFSIERSEDREIPLKICEGFNGACP